MQKRFKRKKTHALPQKGMMNARIFLLSFFFIAGMVFMLYEVGKIQVLHGKEYEEAILSRQNQGEKEIPAQRGTILDRNQRTLASSVLTYNIEISPKAILTLDKDKRQVVYTTLAKALNKKAEEIQKKVEVDSSPQSQYYVLAKNIAAEKAEPLQKLSGVTLNKNYIRKYPKGEMAAQVLGYVNKDGEGKYGVEQQFEEYLKGTSGRLFSQYQEEGIVTSELQSPQNGATVTLTIDEVIQQYMEETMKKYIEEFKPLNATAIIMNPNTGEIYGLYSYPSFNPQTYNDLTKQLGEATWNGLSNEEKSLALNEAWKNHAIQYTYEPGSTFKPFIVAAALDEGAITENTTFNCTGNIQVADRTIPCWKKAGGHGTESVADVLANSCNVGMIQIVEKMDNAKVLDYVKRYGAGETTNIGLLGEEKGILHDKLGPVEKATYSMGQGFNVTPLQLITGFSSVINGGYLMTPYLVQDIKDEKGTILYSSAPSVRRQVISTSVSQTVTQYLKKVVDEGTGTSASVSGYDIGGKTGTAQKKDRKSEFYVASFVGFAPTNHPQVIGAVIFDNVPEHTQAPTNAFKEMMEKILPYLNIDLSPNAQVAYDEMLNEVPDLTGKDIYEAISLLKQNGFDYDLIGVGNLVKAQYPSSGMTRQKGSQIKLYTKTDNLDNIVEVPDVVGLTVEEAKNNISDILTFNGPSSGIIVKQDPKAGSKVEKNSKLIVQTGE